jgi:hypothetical protein
LDKLAQLGFKIEVLIVLEYVLNCFSSSPIQHVTKIDPVWFLDHGLFDINSKRKCPQNLSRLDANLSFDNTGYLIRKSWADLSNSRDLFTCRKVSLSLKVELDDK